MIEIRLDDPRYAKLPRVPSTLVIKRKTVDLYKGRLCTRGDVVPLSVTGFVSSPTVHRSSIKLICSLAVALKWNVRALDISQAFLQSENLRPESRMVVIPPPMVTLPWTGSLPPMGTDLKSLPRSQHGFLLLRPLYGGRDAPMRCWVTLSKRFRSHGFTQLRTDVCTFTKYNGHGQLQALIICHVDDILFTGNEESLRATEDVLRTFRAGETEKLTEKTPIVFTGLLVERLNNGAISLSQSQYASELKKMDPDLYIKQGKVLGQGKFRTALRQGLGALIWLHQTRPDIGFDITKLATDAVEAVTDAELGKKIILLYNKIVRFVQQYDRKILFTDVEPSASTFSDRLQALKQRRIICFTDAGYSPLAGSHSIEGSVTVLGKVVRRDGIVQCHGFLIDHRCAKIQRVCKSSLAAEAHASVTAADQALWMQVYLKEIITGTYNIEQIAPPTEYPLPNPFGLAPTDQEVTAQCRSDLKATMNNHYHCRFCQQSVSRATIMYAAADRRDQIEKTVTAPDLFRPLLLTDCCSLFSAILRIQPRSLDKCAKLVMNQLRDMQTLMDISFIDATCNLGDIETKHAGSLGILSLFFSTGKFVISFLGRKARQELDNANKLPVG